MRRLLRESAIYLKAYEVKKPPAAVRLLFTLSAIRLEGADLELASQNFRVRVRVWLMADDLDLETDLGSEVRVVVRLTC